MLALLLVAASLGASNFAAAVAIGVAGVDRVLRFRIGVVFGIFEAGMPVVGLAIGARVATDLGHAARWAGAATLIAMGGYGLVSSLRNRPAAVTYASTWRLLLSGLALSIDNLVVGFALGAFRTPVVAGALVIGVVSVALSLAGLELGSRLGSRAGQRGEQLAGLMLISVGIAMAAGALS
jgi:manganese efflux pump family protein